jgi:hypothetical protein
MRVTHQFREHSVGFDQIQIFLFVNNKPPQWGKPKPEEKIENRPLSWDGENAEIKASCRKTHRHNY